MKQDGSVGQINDGVFILFILDPGRGVRTGGCWLARSAICNILTGSIEYAMNRLYYTYSVLVMNKITPGIVPEQRNDFSRRAASRPKVPSHSSIK